VSAQAVPSPLINSIVLRLKAMRNRVPIVLPIKTIHTLEVKVSINRLNKKVYELSINTLEFDTHLNKVLEKRFERLPADTNEESFLSRMVAEILRDIKNIKIDKLNGMFVTGLTAEQLAESYIEWADFYQEFKDDVMIGLSLEECCVCFTLTKTKSNCCRHAVCLECVSKLINNGPPREDGELGYRICPMCRQGIDYLYY
jgi:hypothetical protein